MSNDSNPYESPSSEAECGPAVPRDTDAPHWPHRLTVCIVMFASFVLVLPAFQVRRSTGGAHIYADALEALLPLIPFVVLIPALAVSTLRYSKASVSARIVACIAILFYLAFMVSCLYGWTNPY